MKTNFQAHCLLIASTFGSTYATKVKALEKDDDWLDNAACKFYSGVDYSGEYDLFEVKDGEPILFNYDKVAGKMASWQCSKSV